VCLAQALALIPGVSRSVITISAGLFRGLDRVTAVRFSLLLSVPALVGSGLFELRKAGAEGGTGMGVTVLAAIVSFGVGLASIAVLLRFVARHSMRLFVGYRVVLGAVLLVLLLPGSSTSRQTESGLIQRPLDPRWPLPRRGPAGRSTRDGPGGRRSRHTPCAVGDRRLAGGGWSRLAVEAGQGRCLLSQRSGFPMNRLRCRPFSIARRRSRRNASRPRTARPVFVRSSSSHAQVCSEWAQRVQTATSG
jgi:hypothetical protein